MFLWLSEGFKDARLERLFHGISLVSEDVTVLVSPVRASFGSSVGSCKGFNDGNLDVALVRFVFLDYPKGLNITRLMNRYFWGVLYTIKI